MRTDRKLALTQERLVLLVPTAELNELCDRLATQQILQILVSLGLRTESLTDHKETPTPAADPRPSTGSGHDYSSVEPRHHADPHPLLPGNREKHHEDDPDSVHHEGDSAS